ncbi:MAG: hypothetical protein HY724_02555 [Candidatus Rokubacteria bacterium]|nr:hypothetical protein [Candidatus Rokubacteria bacterium]
MCPAVEVKVSCVGWLAGVDYALRCIATGERRILVVAGTGISKGDPFKTVTHRAIFGDGAGAVVIEPSPGQGHFLAGALGTSGRHYTEINLPHVGTVHPSEIPVQIRTLAAGERPCAPRRPSYNIEGYVTRTRCPVGPHDEFAHTRDGAQHDVCSAGGSSTSQGRFRCPTSSDVTTSRNCG